MWYADKFLDKDIENPAIQKACETEATSAYFSPLISLCSESSRACAVDAFSRRSTKNAPLNMYNILLLVYNAKKDVHGEWNTTNG